MLTMLSATFLRMPAASGRWRQARTSPATSRNARQQQGVLNRLPASSLPSTSYGTPFGTSTSRCHLPAAQPCVNMLAPRVLVPACIATHRHSWNHEGGHQHVHSPSGMHSIRCSSCCDGQPSTSTGFTSAASSSINACSITSVEDLQAVFDQVSGNKEAGQKVTIDLGGRTLTGGHVEKSQLLLLSGAHAHVCLTNGCLHLPRSWQLEVRNGASLKLIGVQVISIVHPYLARDTVIWAERAGTKLQLEDCRIHRRKSAGQLMDIPALVPLAVVVESGAEAIFNRCLIEGTRAGIQVRGSGTSALLAACAVMHCGETAYYVEGAGVLKASHCLALSNEGTGFKAWGEGTVLQLTDCRSEKNERHGLHAARDALVVLDECVLLQNGQNDVRVEGGAKLELAGVIKPGGGDLHAAA